MMTGNLLPDQENNLKMVKRNALEHMKNVLKLLPNTTGVGVTNAKHVDGVRSGLVVVTQLNVADVDTVRLMSDEVANLLEKEETLRVVLDMNDLKQVEKLLNGDD